MAIGIAALIPSIIATIGNIIDKAIPDKDKAAELKTQVALEAMKQDNSELTGAISIILAEAQGESWLQRNWRPALMVWFSVLVGGYWFGFTPENLPEKVVLELFALVQIGVGGYIAGRSGEKMLKTWKEKP